MPRLWRWWYRLTTAIVVPMNNPGKLVPGYKSSYTRSFSAVGMPCLKLVFVLLQGNAHQLAAGTDAGLFEQLLQRGLYRTFGDVQPAGDFFIRQAFENQGKDLAFAFGESLGAR